MNSPLAILRCQTSPWPEEFLRSLWRAGLQLALKQTALFSLRICELRTARSAIVFLSRQPIQVPCCSPENKGTLARHPSLGMVFLVVPFHLARSRKPSKASSAKSLGQLSLKDHDCFKFVKARPLWGRASVITGISAAAAG